MTSTGYLYAAYAVTWIIHGVYLITVVRRYARVRSQIEELKRK